ncbi:hypothetical protein COU56_04935 [Candidatus Pacearchaeota archaeon CG10_big_fil_rev_8_21_14_0_10_31_9]|nr:MAG: hypothetical protein COU56_04935 [Candidatus Pacearchaeota archaeon CG10_big_fil_rev_8_21_14_0_10_31_9]
MRGAFENRDRNSFPTILLADRTHPTQYSGSTYSPFNFTDSVYLLDFNEEETRNYIIAGCRKNGIDLTGEAAAKAWEQTQGQPYLVNKIGELLVLGARQDKKSEVTEKDVETACEFIMDEALAGSDAHFITLRRYLGDEKKEGDVYLDRPQKSELMNILHRGGSRFDLTNRELSVLFSLGFIGPTEVKMKYGKVVLAGDARIRNPLYKEFLENHL